MFPFRPVNLPLPVLLPSGTILGLGLYLSIFRTFPSITMGNRGKKFEILVPRPVTSRMADTNALLGLVSSSLMLPYFLSSYMPIEENQFLHVSVPIRLWLVAGFVGHMVLRGREGMSEEGVLEFLTLTVVDLAGAVWLGLHLGSFDGRVPSFK